MKKERLFSVIVATIFAWVAIMFLILVPCIKASAQTYPPSCVVTMPHSNAYFKSGTDVVIKVYSTDIGKSQNNGTVSKVEFYNGTTKLGEATTATNNTYTFIWGCVPAGTYTIKAVATNNKGVSFTSVGTIITVGTAAVSSKGMSACKGKYLANVIPGSAQLNYNSLWNGVTAENNCKWGPVEGTRDQFSWTGAEVCYNHAKTNNMMFRYHAGVWASQYPSWFTGLSTADARAEVVEYFTAIAARFPLADQIDVLNEQLRTHQNDNQKFREILGGAGTTSTNFAWQIWLFEQARALFPNTKLILNDYGLENDQSAINEQINLIKVLRDRGLIDGFGSQAHCFNIDGMTGTALKSSLDLMATAGVPIYITELDLNGGVENDNNEAQQLSSFQTHFPVYWEHPAVAGVSIWGYINGATWIGGTGLMSSSGTEKSAMKWLKTYISGKTDVGYPQCSTAPSGSCCATPAPTVTKTAYSYKVGETATTLSATGTDLKWYTVPAGGTTLAAAPTPSTTAVGTTTYYVSQTAGGCESMRTSIAVTVYKPQSAYGGTPAPIPGTIQFENFDEGGQDTAYSDNSVGSSVTPVVNFRTTEDVDIENCTDAGTGYNLGYTAAGEWTEYTVNVAAAGTYKLVIRAACDGAGRTISISAKGVDIAKDIAIPNTAGWQTWQDVTVNNVKLDAGIQVIRLTIGATDYVNLNYMTFSSVGSSIPVVTSPLSLCQGTTATALSATGTALQWYSAATGGTPLAAAPVPNTSSVGSTTYYVSQTVGGVESARAAIVVNVNATPAAPTVSSPVTYALNAVATPLSATGTALLWYTTATNGTGSATAPTPITTTNGATSFYVTQTTANCESPRAIITVNVGNIIKIQLKTGWNLVGCPLTGSTPLKSSLSSIWPSVLVVKDMETFFLSTNPAALNSLNTTDWGKGYMVKVSADCTLDWIAR